MGAERELYMIEAEYLIKVECLQSCEWGCWRMRGEEELPEAFAESW